VSDPDPLVEEIVRARRDRRPLVIGAAIGIIAGLALGMAMFLGALGGDRSRNHAALAFFVTPLIVSMAVGYSVYRWRTRRRR
jgi:CHASE2 domain-containing sensor protein